MSAADGNGFPDYDPETEGPPIERGFAEPSGVRGYPLFRIPIPSEELADTYDRYIERRDRLAKLLFEFYHGDGTWENRAELVGPEAEGNYTADADEVLHLHPHLVSMDIADAMPIYKSTRPVEVTGR